MNTGVVGENRLGRESQLRREGESESERRVSEKENERTRRHWGTHTMQDWGLGEDRTGRED